MKPEEARNIIETGLSRLVDLDPATPPLFGRMSTFDMLDHLMASLNLTFYTGEVKMRTPADKVEKAQSFLSSKHMIRPGAQQPDFYEELKADSIEPADWEKSVLNCVQLYDRMKIELDTSDDLWRKDLPVFGRLNRDQWWLFQGKHFYHHLSQFGIFPRTETWGGLST